LTVTETARITIQEKAPGATAPRDFDALRAEVMDLYAQMPKRLAQAARYAVSHPEEIALGTAASVAGACGVQPSTLVRLARHLGYEGFSDLQLVFRDRLRYRSSSYEERLEKIDQAVRAENREAELLRGFVGAARQSIENLGEKLNPAVFAGAVATLGEARTVYLLARRRAYPVVAHLAYAFGKLKIQAHVLDSPNAIDMEIAAQADPTDALLVCSFAPYTANTIELASSIAQRGTPLVAITDSAFSPLARITRHLLEVSENDYAGFRSLSASMALATALPVAIAEYRRLAK
jgi:DNA-binding MurR/RpiR family transcriptional regulator